MKTSIVVALLFASLLSRSRSAIASEADVCATAAEDAQSFRDKGKLKEAREGFARCARDTCPKIVAKDCAPWLDETEKRLPSLVFRVHDEKGGDLADVVVTANGAPLVSRLDGSAVVMNPGEVTLRFESSSRPSVERVVVIAEGEKARVVDVIMPKAGTHSVAAPAPKPPAETSPPRSVALKVTPWVFVGVSAASLATFGVLQGVARSELSTVQSGCGKTKTCSEADLGPIRTKFVVSGVALGLSIASLAVASGIWIFSPKDHSVPRVSIAPGPLGGFATATWALDL